MMPAKRFPYEALTAFFLPVRLATIWSVLLVMTFMGNDPPADAELSANQVMIVANANSRESLMVAEHYATSRGVPLQQIAKLDLSLDDTTSRADYERRVVMPLRQALQDLRIQQSIRVLVTVYGVPLRVASPRLTAEEQHWQRDARDRLGAARSQLEDIERRARDIAVQSGSKAAPPAREGQGMVAYERHVAFLLRVDEAVQESVKRVKQLKPATFHDWSAQLEVVVRGHQGLAGLAQLHHDLLREGHVSVGGADAPMRAEQLEGLQLLLGSLELPVRSRRTELYQQVGQVYGAYGVFGLAALELDRLSDELADASVDSELSLLWWDRTLFSPVASRDLASGCTEQGTASGAQPRTRPRRPSRRDPARPSTGARKRRLPSPTRPRRNGPPRGRRLGRRSPERATRVGTRRRTAGIRWICWKSRRRRVPRARADPLRAGC